MKLYSTALTARWDKPCIGVTIQTNRGHAHIAVGAQPHNHGEILLADETALRLDQNKLAIIAKEAAKMAEGALGNSEDAFDVHKSDVGASVWVTARANHVSVRAAANALLAAAKMVTR